MLKPAKNKNSVRSSLMPSTITRISTTIEEVLEMLFNIKIYQCQVSSASKLTFQRALYISHGATLARWTLNNKLRLEWDRADWLVRTWRRGVAFSMDPWLVRRAAGPGGRIYSVRLARCSAAAFCPADTAVKAPPIAPVNFHPVGARPCGPGSKYERRCPGEKRGNFHWPSIAERFLPRQLLTFSFGRPVTSSFLFRYLFIYLFLRPARTPDAVPGSPRLISLFFI